LKFLLGLVVGLILVPLGAYLYLTGSSVPVATSDGDMPFEAFFARKALHERIEKEMPKTVPVELSEVNYVAGAEVYKEQCAVCHGLPLAPKTAIAAGMYPRPPQLFEGKGVTDDEAGESYWKVANGIRLTGMPGFNKTLSPTQMWQVSVLLAHADKLPPAAKQALVTTLSSPGAPASTTPQASPSAAPAQPAASAPAH
jgi:thiosulfate dehydrogenase